MAANFRLLACYVYKTKGPTLESQKSLALAAAATYANANGVVSVAHFVCLLITSMALGVAQPPTGLEVWEAKLTSWQRAE